MAIKQNSWVGWNVLDAISKLLIPILLAYLTWVQSENFDKSRKEEAKIAEVNRKVETETANRQKLVELTWRSLVSNNENEKITALKLLNNLDKKTGQILASAIAENPGNSVDVRQQASILIMDFLIMRPSCKIIRSIFIL